MKNLVGMAIFARVAEAKSFSEAARRLGLSKSMVSKEVTKLERSRATPSEMYLTESIPDVTYISEYSRALNFRLILEIIILLYTNQDFYSNHIHLILVLIL